MSRKILGFFAFVATGYALLLTNIVRQQSMVDVVVSVAIIVLAAVGLKGHYEELKG